MNIYQVAKLNPNALFLLSLRGHFSTAGPLVVFWFSHFGSNKGSDIAEPAGAASLNPVHGLLPLAPEF